MPEWVYSEANTGIINIFLILGYENKKRKKSFTVKSLLLGSVVSVIVKSCSVEKLSMLLQVKLQIEVNLNLYTTDLKVLTSAVAS